MKSAAVKEKQRTLQQNDNYLQTATDFTETEWDRDPELQKRELLEQYDENSNKEIQSGSSDNGDEKQSNVETQKSGAVKSLFTKSTYSHAKKFSGYQVLNGIDVSQWQGNINWSKVKKSGVSYAIIRVGYRGSDSGSLREDTRYLSYIKGALKAGIKVGVYIYSQAVSEKEAREEANFVLKRIQGYNISMPVVLDYEFYTSTSGRLYKAHLSKREATNVCKAFCKTVENAGYTPMVYGNVDMLTNHLYGEEVAANADVWVANFGKNNGKDRNFATIYNGTYSFWQYTSRGNVPGISGNVDCNFWYKNTEATEISITDESISMVSNTEAYLYHSLMPAGSKDNIVWTSSNPAVAYVKDGYVYGVSQGETVITATTSTGATDTCKVFVTENMNNYEIGEIAAQNYSDAEVEPEVSLQSKVQVAAQGTTKKSVAVFAGPDDAYALVKTLSKNVDVVIEATLENYYAISFKVGQKNYTGFCKKSLIKAKKAYKTLVQNRDFMVKYSSNTEVGSGLVEATGISDWGYQGTISKIFEIKRVSIANATIAAISEQINQGVAVTPKVKVQYAGKYLVEGKDYEVVYQNNQYMQGSIPSGSAQAQIIVKGIGNFIGEKQVTYQICDMEIVSVEEIPEQVYTGNAICPPVKVYDKNGMLLADGVDYSVEYSNNIEVGDACAAITLLKEGTGQTKCSIYYQIVAKDVSQTNIKMEQAAAFQMANVIPAICVQDNEKVLQEGVDYTCTYAQNYNAGEGSVTIWGKGHYKGKKTQTFSIMPASISEVSVATIAKQYYKAGKVTPILTVKHGKEVLVRNRDYVVTYENNTKRGTATATVVGKGNYTGSKTVQFVIGKQKIANCKIAKIGNKKYKKTRICPKVSIRNGGKKLKKGRDYTVHYGVNKKVGKGTVTIKGKGNYSGKKTISFRIVK